MRRRLRSVRRRSRLVVVAAVALVLVVISGCRGGGRERAVVIDESKATYNGVGLGSSAREVRRAFGDGSSEGGFAPLGRLPSEVGVPLSLPNPPGAGQERPKLLRYQDAAFLLVRDHVFAMMLTGSRLRTTHGVAIGADLDDVRRSYAGVACYDAPGGEPLAGGVATYPVCRIRLGRRRSLSFGGDPIHSFTFFSRQPVLDERHPPPLPGPVAMTHTPPAALAICRRLTLISSTCPRRVPTTHHASAQRPPGYRGLAAGGAIALCADERLRGVPITSGACRYQTWSLEVGAPAGLPPDAPPGIRGQRLGPGRTRPPQYVHIVIYAGRGTVANLLFPFAWPHARGAAISNRLLSPKRTRPISLGRIRWAGHYGQLVLAPPLVFGGEVGDHLVFHWKEGGVEHVVSLHSWAPLPEAVATLKAVVDSTT